MTREEAIEYNKNLREYMKITDKDSEYKFLKENYEALDMAIKALEQEPILDKIREEIEQNAYPIVHGVNNNEKGMTLYGILQVIDKYTAESTSNCNSCEHKNEVDGSNCYECVKGIRNNYTAESEE